MISTVCPPRYGLYTISKIPLLTLEFGSVLGHQVVLARFGKGRREELVN